MRRTFSLTFLFIVALCTVASFGLYNSGYRYSQVHTVDVHNDASLSRSDRLTSTPFPKQPMNAYLYYVLKDARGFMLARSLKGSAGQPLSAPQSLTLMGGGFGRAGTDSVLSMQLSPDARYLAIDGTRADAEQVWVYDTQRVLVDLLPAHAMGNFLHWLPGGNRHTFLYRPMFPLGRISSQEREAWNATLWLIDAATGIHTNLNLGVPAANLIDATSSPDGTRIVYSTSAGLGMGSETWMIKCDGRARTYLFRSTGLEAVNALFSWSPDGKSIAYERLADSATPFLNAGLWLMNMQGKQQQRLTATDGGHGYAPLWSPDSHKIAFIVRTNPNDLQANVQAQALQSAIGVVDASSKQTWLVASPDETGMQLNVNPTWTADSASITFTALNATNRVIGGTPRYWSTSAASSHIRPSARVLTPSISHVVAIG